MTDFAAILRTWLDDPTRTEPDEKVAKSMGYAILRQLQPRTESTGNPLRMSAIGGCARALAFKLARTPEDGAKMTARSRTTFAMGDMAEMFLATALAPALRNPPSSWHVQDIRSATGQAEVTLPIWPYEDPHVPVYLSGHPDGMLVDAEGNRVILEIKSASSYAFAEWSKAIKDDRPPWYPKDAGGYWWQIQGYMYATMTPRGYVLALNKDSGAILGFYVDAAETFLPALAQHLRNVLQGAQEPHKAPRRLPGGTELGPVRKLRKTTSKWGKEGDPLPADGDLHWRCRFCAYHRTCWGEDLYSETRPDYRGVPTKFLRLKSWDKANR